MEYTVCIPKESPLLSIVQTSIYEVIHIGDPKISNKIRVHMIEIPSSLNKIPTRQKFLRFSRSPHLPHQACWNCILCPTSQLCRPSLRMLQQPCYHFWHYPFYSKHGNKIPQFFACWTMQEHAINTLITSLTHIMPIHY